MVIYIRTEFAEVVEWQTRRTQNPLRDDLVRVQVPPSAPIKSRLRHQTEDKGACLAPFFHILVPEDMFE